VKILHSVMNHERGGAGSKLVALSRTDRPGGCSANRFAFTVGPFERRATPFLDIDSEMFFVPSLKRRSVFGFERRCRRCQ
jgi:hypothetical protein